MASFSKKVGIFFSNLISMGIKELFVPDAGKKPSFTEVIIIFLKSSPWIQVGP